MIQSNNNPIRHGEVFLQRVDTLPEGKTKKAKSYIVGHSESGHHHVLEAKTGFNVVEAANEIFLELEAEATITHKKTHDKHPNVLVSPGKYKVWHKKEYSPFEKVMRKVFD